MGGPRHHRVSFSGRRSCFGTEQRPLPLRSHHCQAFESKKQKSSFPRRRCYRFCKLIDRGRKGGSPRERPLVQNHCIFGRADPSYSYCGWGNIGGDVYINDHHCVGRLRSEFPIPRTPEEGELEQSLVHRPQRRNNRDCMRFNPIRVCTRTRWQMDSGALRLLTQTSIIKGPGRTPYLTQAPGRIGVAPCGTRTSRPGP